MTRTATTRPHTRTGRRRAPAATALALAAGLLLAACSSEPDTDPTTGPTAQEPTSSSTSPTSTSTGADTPVPASAPAAPTSATAAPTVDLPANVVGTGGPCQRLGEVAQADDGSALFCTEDPGGAGPLWLPAGAGAEVPSDAPAGAPGAARPGGPCMQEGVVVAGPEGTPLTCALLGGGDIPGGLFWQ